MTLSPGIERALDTCYEAVLSPQGWTGALDVLSTALGGHSCNLIAHDRASRNVAFISSTEMGRWNELWGQNTDWAVDLCSPRGQPRVQAGSRSLLQSDLFSEDEVNYSRFYQEIAGPSGCRHWASASFLLNGDAWCLPVFRPTPFTRSDTARFSEVSYHLARIVRISRTANGAWETSALSALDHFGRAAMTVDRSGRIDAMNAAAAATMSPDFCVRGGRLSATGRANQDRIDALLHAIRSATPDAFLEGPVAVVTRDGLPWLAIDTLPLAPRAAEAFSGARAILVVSDLTETTALAAGALQAIFGLTPAEARVALALRRGLSLGEMARDFGVGSVTVRSHLKSIFAKTGTRRQAELVAVLARI